MTTQEIIKSQYRASLAMIGEAISKCSDALWNDPAYTNPFWHLAYHALFYTHLYLQESGQTYVPWSKHRQEYEFLGPLPFPPHREPNIGQPYTKQEVLEFLELCRRYGSEMTSVVFEVPLLGHVSPFLCTAGRSGREASASASWGICGATV